MSNKMPTKHTPSQPSNTRRQRPLTCIHALAMGAAFGLSGIQTPQLWAAELPNNTQLAQLRVYDAASGKNVTAAPESFPAPVTRTAPPVIRPVSATSIGGLRMAPGQQQAPATAPLTQTLSARPRTAITTPAAQRRGQSLGTAMVFVKAADFSSQISTRIKEINRFPGLVSTFYMQDESPRNLVGMSASSLRNLPQGIGINVDLDSTMAKAYDAQGKNLIIYRDPTGAVRQYNLVSEYASFLNQLNRLRGL